MLETVNGLIVMPSILNCLLLHLLMAAACFRHDCVSTVGASCVRAKAAINEHGSEFEMNNPTGTSVIVTCCDSVALSNWWLCFNTLNEQIKSYNCCQCQAPCIAKP